MPGSRERGIPLDEPHAGAPVNVPDDVASSTTTACSPTPSGSRTTPSSRPRWARTRRCGAGWRRCRPASTRSAPASSASSRRPTRPTPTRRRRAGTGCARSSRRRPTAAPHATPSSPWRVLVPVLGAILAVAVVGAFALRDGPIGTQRATDEAGTAAESADAPAVGGDAFKSAYGAKEVAADLEFYETAFVGRAGEVTDGRQRFTVVRQVKGTVTGDVYLEVVDQPIPTETLTLVMLGAGALGADGCDASAGPDRPRCRSPAEDPVDRLPHARRCGASRPWPSRCRPTSTSTSCCPSLAAASERTVRGPRASPDQTAATRGRAYEHARKAFGARHLVDGRPIVTTRIVCRGTGRRRTPRCRWPACFLGGCGDERGRRTRAPPHHRRLPPGSSRRRQRRQRGSATPLRRPPSGASFATPSSAAH